MVIVRAVALIPGLTVRDRLGLNLFTRLFTYDNDSANITFSHGGRSENLFLTLDYKLLVCSDGFLQMFSPKGESLLRQNISLTNPAVSTNGTQAVIYDVGGLNLYVLSRNKLAFSLTQPEDQTILSASVNQSGWLTVTSKEDGYRGTVTVYDATYTPIVSIRLSSSYPTHAMVTPDARGLYILTNGQADGAFESRLLYYDLSSAQEPISQISLGNNVILTSGATGNRCWFLGEQALFVTLSSGELGARYTYDGKYLVRSSLDGNGFATLLLTQSPTANSGTLVTVDTDGTVLGSLELTEPVIALSAAGRYVAVLTSSSLQVYTKNLSEISTSTSIQGIQNITLFPDGSVALISDDFLRIYLS